MDKPEVERYLPEFINNLKEYQQINKIYDDKLGIVWDCINKIMSNLTITTSDEDGIAYYERILNITPPESDSLTARRQRVMAKWIGRIIFTYYQLVTRLKAIYGYNIEISNNFETGYSLFLRMHIGDYDQLDELKEIIKWCVPLNICVDIDNTVLVTLPVPMASAVCIRTSPKIGITSGKDEQVQIAKIYSIASALQTSCRVKIKSYGIHPVAIKAIAAGTALVAVSCNISIPN